MGLEVFSGPAVLVLNVLGKTVLLLNAWPSRAGLCECTQRYV